MIVDHLYVIAILASLDSDGDKKLETVKTAQALFARHGPKAKTAALIQISNLHSGSGFNADVLDALGDNVPLGIGSKPWSPEPVQNTASIPSALNKNDAVPDGKQEKPLVVQKQPVVPGSVGIYLVFHSDGGGMSLMPTHVSDMIAKVVPQPLHAGVKKISLFACWISDRGEGDPIDKVIGMTMQEVHNSYRVKLIGGLEIMVSMLGYLADKGIRPMICGYDIPVFAGDGPYKSGKPSRGVKKRVDGEWKNTTYDDPDVYGRKLTIYQDGRQSLGTIKGRMEGNADYRKLHKKVLRLDDQGRIAEALAGWSSKD